MDKYIEKLLTKFEDDVIYDNNNITIDERLKEIDNIIK